MTSESLTALKAEIEKDFRAYHHYADSAEHPTMKARIDTDVLAHMEMVDDLLAEERRKALTEAANAINVIQWCRHLHDETCLRCEALFEAVTVVRALSASPQEETK